MLAEVKVGWPSESKEARFMECQTCRLVPITDEEEGGGRDEV